MMNTQQIRGIPLQDLRACARTLRAIRDNYKMGESWDALVEAKRLVMIEIREQHGDAAWETAEEDPDA